MHILVVEDEKKLAAALRKGLEAEKHSVRVVHNGEEAFFLVSTECFDLVLLDVMLPGRDGIEILRAARQENFAVPVLGRVNTNVARRRDCSGRRGEEVRVWTHAHDL